MEPTGNLGLVSSEERQEHPVADHIREAHERPEAMEEASVMMVGLNPERILQGLIVLENQRRGNDRTLCNVKDYSMPNVSDKVVRIIVSYNDYINRVVWRQ